MKNSAITGSPKSPNGISRNARGFTLVELAVTLVAAPIDASINYGIWWAIGKYVFHSTSALLFWPFIAATTVASVISWLILAEYGLVNFLFRVAVSVAIYFVPWFWQQPDAATSAVANAARTAVVAPPSPVVANPASAAVVAPPSPVVANAPAKPPSGSEVAEALRGEYHPVDVAGCKAAAVLTITRARVVTEGCQADAANSVELVTHSETEDTLHVLTLSSGGNLTLKLRPDGSLTIVEPQKWKGSWRK